jgi:hypothetical protein
VWPNSKIEATKCVVPFGAVVTPRKPLPDMPVVPYDPVRCKGCAACLNPYARVDFNGAARTPLTLFAHSAPMHTTLAATSSLASHGVP